MRRNEYSPGNYESSSGKGKEILLSELASTFPELATAIIEELDLNDAAEDPILILYPDGSIQIK